jgi:GTP-binding protein
MTAYAFRALQRMNRTDLCPNILPYWMTCISNNNNNNNDNNENNLELSSGMVLIKGYNRLQRSDLAEEVVSKFQVKLSPSSLLLNEISDKILLSSIKILPEMALSYAHIGKFEKCLLTLHAMKAISINIDIDTSKNILKVVLRESNSWFIRETIRALLELDGLNDNDSIQLLTSSFMKNLDFVTGAVSLRTLPIEDMHCPEVCFIGRSNVGKSSLINMIANRKGLAFTSKTAGKTTEFNYFKAEGLTGGVMEKTKFHLVDLPGVGYAEASYERREGWLDLLKEFVKTRKTLRVVFHLVDARHGLLQADEECLSILSDLPETVAYVIVLTKVDKLGGEVSRDFINKIDRELKSRRSGQRTSILLTSSDTRVGGVDVWSVMLDAFNYPDVLPNINAKLYSTIR